MEDGSRELSILVDRSVGGASIKDGQIELMLHRYIFNSNNIVQYFVASFIFFFGGISVDNVVQIPVK